MTYTAPDGTRYPSRYRFLTRHETSLHVYACLVCGALLDDPETGLFRRSGAEYCSSTCRSRAWREARLSPVEVPA